jgi:CelD/BcsL family acetyltransferase involved in cellulose biosynthesis
MTQASKSLTVSHIEPDELSGPDLVQWTSMADQQEAPANPFLAPAWILRWYECFVKPADRRLFLVHSQDTGALVAVAPMYRQVIGRGRLALATRLMPVGAGVGPNPVEIPGVLTAAGRAREIVKTLVQEILRLDTTWCEIALTASMWFEPEWIYNSPADVVFSEYQRSRPCVILPLGSTWEETRSSLKRNLKESLRRSQNRIAKSGRQFEVVHRTSTEVDQTTVREFLELHRTRSHNSVATVQHPDAYADGRNRALLQAVIPELARQGRASIFQLLLDGEVVAAQLVLHANGTSYVHSSGFRSDVWDYGPVTLLHGELVRHAIDRGDTVVNFSPGPNVSKLRWSEQLSVTNEFAVGAGSRSLQVRYGLYHTLSALRATSMAIAFTKAQSTVRP